jgi:hydroxymethylpyrimidine pyrophosphatase-like HAD family hydrolase
MPHPRLVAFDLDDTLAPSKSAIDPRIGELLIALAERVEVAIISGGQLAQFQAQVVDRLPDASAAVLSHFHLLPTCGTQYYRLKPDGIETVYAHSLTDDEKARVLAAGGVEARRRGVWV